MSKQQPNPAPAGFVCNAGPLFEIAKRAYHNAKAATKNDRGHESEEPLIAIVFAAAAAEAFINEFAKHAEIYSHLGKELAKLVDHTPDPEWTDPPTVDLLAALLPEAEKHKASPNSKYQIAKLVLTSKTFDGGGPPFQDFVSLMKLRNAIMHMDFDQIKSVKIGEVEVEYPGIIKNLESKGILADIKSDKNTICSWLLLVRTPAVAKWACNATANIVKDIMDSVPATGLLRKTMDSMQLVGAFAPLA